MKKLVPLILFLLIPNFAMAQDLIKLPEVEKTQTKSDLIVLPQTPEKPVVEEIKKQEEKSEIEPAKKIVEDEKPSGKQPSQKEEAVQTPQKTEVKKDDNQKIMVLKSQKPLPKFYSILSKQNYRDTILNSLSYLAQVDAKIVSFDTDKGYLLFDTPINRYLVTIFEFNNRQWIKILPMQETFKEDKVLQEFMQRFT